MNTRENFRKLHASLEMRLIRNRLLAACLGVAAMFVITLIRQERTLDAMNLKIMIGCAAAVVLQTALVSFFQAYRILRKPEAYIFCRAALDVPHLTRWQAHRVYYSLVLEDPVYGYKYYVNTRAIFQRRGILGLLAEDYTGRTVTVAYNRITETVVVIG